MFINFKFVIDIVTNLEKEILNNCLIIRMEDMKICWIYQIAQNLIHNNINYELEIYKKHIGVHYTLIYIIIIFSY